MKSIFTFIALVVLMASCKKEDPTNDNKVAGLIEEDKTYYIAEESYTHGDTVDLYYNYGQRRRKTISGTVVLDTTTLLTSDSAIISFFNDSIVTSYKESNLGFGGSLSFTGAFYESGTSFSMPYRYFFSIETLDFTAKLQGNFVVIESSDGRFRLKVIHK